MTLAKPPLKGLLQAGRFAKVGGLAGVAKLVLSGDVAVRARLSGAIGLDAILVDPADIEGVHHPGGRRRLQATYVTAKELAEPLGSLNRYVIGSLTEAGVRPVLPIEENTRTRVNVYRRGDVPADIDRRNHRRYG